MASNNLHTRFTNNKTKLLFVSYHLFASLSIKVAPPQAIKNKLRLLEIKQTIRLTQKAVHKKQLSKPKLSTALFCLNLYKLPNGPSDQVKVRVIA